MSKNDLVTSNKTTFVLLKCPKANTKNFVPPGVWLGPKPFFFRFIFSDFLHLKKIETNYQIYILFNVSV